MESFDFCEVLRDLLDIAYVESVQSTLVQAQYWHDPFQKDLHRFSLFSYLGIDNIFYKDDRPSISGLSIMKSEREHHMLKNIKPILLNWKI